MRRRWLFGDQLGPQFLDDPDQPVLMIEAHRVLRPVGGDAPRPAAVDVEADQCHCFALLMTEAASVKAAGEWSSACSSYSRLTRLSSPYC